MYAGITSITLSLLLAVGAFAHQLKYDIVEVTLISQTVRFTIKAEVADTDTKRSVGLMYRKGLTQDAGMLFVYADEAPRSFWMKNTLIPLDIIFISGEFKIVYIAQNVAPCEQTPCSRYSSGAPVKYVLEVNAGLIPNIGLAPGDYVEFDLGSKPEQSH